MLQMSVVITSFQESKRHNGTKYSVASFQPTGFNYPNLAFLAPLDATGQRIHLNKNALADFQAAVERAYNTRWEMISSWLNKLSNQEDIVLCCWCPYSQSSKEQIKEYGFFACHTGLLALLIKQHRPDIILRLGEKHQNLLYPPWNPFFEESTKTNSFEEILF